MRQVLPFFQAVLGVSRSGLGYLLLRARCKKLSGLPDQEFYSRAWQYSQKISWLLSGRASHANRFRFSWQNYVVIKLNEHITGTSELPEWMINLKDGNHALERREGPAQIILCTHAKLTYAIIATLKTNGHVPVLVRSFKKRYDGNQAETDDFEPEVITVNKDVLLNIRKAGKSGKTVVALPDFTRRRAKTLFHDHFVSTALFEFAMRSKIEIVFAAASVTQKGAIRIDFEHPEMAQRDCTAETVAEQFREFITRSTGKRPEWELAGSPQEFEYLKHQFKDFCIG